MANIAASVIETLMLDFLQANVSTDPPLTTGVSGQTYEFMNQAYALLWKKSGGTLKTATSATLWSPAQSSDTTGKATGLLQTIEEIGKLWATTTSSSTGGGSGDTLLDPVPVWKIEMLRTHGMGGVTYTTPQVYAVSMINSANAAASTNLWQLDYWPGVAGYYFPAHYKPQFTALANTTDVPDLPDIFQRDIAPLAAWMAAPIIRRPDFQPSLFTQLSEITQAALERKQRALVSAEQDR